MELCPDCEEVQTSWHCPRCKTANCESCRETCYFCKRVVCDSCCCECDRHEDMNQVCEYCMQHCETINCAFFCPYCVPETCNRCDKLWCDDCDNDINRHAFEHRRRFVITYMVLVFHCNRVILETVANFMKPKMLMMTLA